MEPTRNPIRARCFVVGILLMPINAYWIIQMEITWYAGHPTTISLFFNVVLFMVVIALLNGLVQKLFGRDALNPAELASIYVMLCMASAMAGHDMIQVLAPILTHYEYWATPENNWAELFDGKLPRQLLVTSEAAIAGYAEGGSSLYLPEHYRPWIRPVLAWSGFLTVLVFTTMCINVLFLREWTHNEKLAFPVIGLPLAIATRPKKLCWNTYFLVGFLLAASIATINGLHHLYPDLWPLVRAKRTNLTIFRDLGPPWDAVGWFPVSYYPCVIGLSYLMPLDLMFSCWFFFLFFKVQRVFLAWLGWTPALPKAYINQQSVGAYFAIAFSAVWVGREHLLRVARRILGLARGLSDDDEPLRYRSAALGAVLGFVGLIVFARWAGLSRNLAIIYFLLYLGISVGIARMRATCGPPAHDLHFAGPGEILAATVGTAHMSGRSLGAMTLFFGFNRAYRGHPTAHSLEGFRLGQQTQANPRMMFAAQVVGVLAGCLAAFWAMLHIGYSNAGGAPGTWFARAPYWRLARWVQQPTQPEHLSYACYAAGFLVVMLLPLVKLRFPGVPFHPIGYAISPSWSMHLVWFPILIGWLCKTVIVRYLGGSGYRRFMPFFMGLILGDYVVGGGWCLASLIVGRGMYAFWY